MVLGLRWEGKPIWVIIKQAEQGYVGTWKEDKQIKITPTENVN